VFDENNHNNADAKKRGEVLSCWWSGYSVICCFGIQDAKKKKLSLFPERSIHNFLYFFFLCLFVSSFVLLISLKTTNEQDGELK